jgi:hypothetical protein
MPKGGRGKPAERKTSAGGNAPIQYAAQSLNKHAPVVDPLTPRPRLLALLAVVFAVWMAFLVYLYFKTVYPHRSAAPRAAAPAAVA